MTASKARTAFATGCFLLITLPFAAVGAVMAWRVGSAVWTRLEMISWVETPAMIEAVELRSRDGETSTMYEVRARYSYTFDGKRYEGRRVGIHRGADNIGRFQLDAFREIEAYRRTGRPAPCFVDPRDPSRAVLLRAIRWRLLTFKIVFGLVFGGVGFGLLAAYWLGREDRREQERRRGLHPDEPWRWRQDWGEGRVRASGRAGLVMPCAIAVFWNSIVVLTLIFGLDEVRKGNWKAVFVLVFVPPGVWLAVRAVKAVRRWRRFGDSLLELESVPVRRGGPLQATLLASGDIGPGVGFDLTASCIRKRGSDDGEKVFWQERWRVESSRVVTGGDRLRVPVEIDLPAEPEASALGGKGGEVEWRLEARAELPGVDYEARFELPVYGGSAAAESEKPEATAAAHDSASAFDSESAMAFRQAGLRMEPLSVGGWRLVAPRFRHGGVGLGLALVLGLWIAAGAALYTKGAPGTVLWLLGISGLVILIGVLEVWCRERSVEADPRGLTLRSGLFGPGRPRRLGREAISEVKGVPGFQAGSRLYYRVLVVDRDGKKHVAASGLDDQALARRLAAAIEAQLGR